MFSVTSSKNITTTATTTTEGAKEIEDEDVGNFASLIVVAGIIPGFLCIFIVCLNCPKVLDKMVNKVTE